MQDAMSCRWHESSCGPSWEFRTYGYRLLTNLLRLRAWQRTTIFDAKIRGMTSAVCYPFGDQTMGMVDHRVFKATPLDEIWPLERVNDMVTVVGCGRVLLRWTAESTTTEPRYAAGRASLSRSASRLNAPPARR